MPGFVGLIGFGIALILALFVATVVATLLKLVLKWSWKKGFGFGLLLGLAAGGWLLWSSFGTHINDISYEEIVENYPEIEASGGKITRTYSFVDGLSDGIFIEFQIELSDFRKFLENRPVYLKVPDSLDGFASLNSHLNPEWFPPKKCAGGEAYIVNFEKLARKKTRSSLDHFRFLYCPMLGKAYAANIRI